MILQIEILRNMEKTQQIYCFTCKILFDYPKWNIHSSHHYELFMFPPKILENFELLDCLFHSPKRNIFKMRQNFSNNVFAVYFNEINQLEYESKKNLFDVLIEHQGHYLCKSEIISYNVNFSLLMIMMEFHENKLSNFIETLDFKQKIKIFSNICEDITYLHQNHYIHGNLSLENIHLNIVNNDVSPIVLGVINSQMKKEINYDFLYEYTNKNIWSPEFLKGENVNEKFDVWCLGILFHQLFFDKKFPFIQYDQNYKLLHKMLRNGKKEILFEIGSGVEKYEQIENIIKSL